jgi:hypothetical protein
VFKNMVVLGKNTVGVVTGVFAVMEMGGSIEVNGPRKVAVDIIVVPRDVMAGIIVPREVMGRIMPADPMRIIGRAGGRMPIGGGRPPARAVVPATIRVIDVPAVKSRGQEKKCDMVGSSSEEKAASNRPSRTVRG